MKRLLTICVLSTATVALAEDPKPAATTKVAATRPATIAEAKSLERADLLKRNADVAAIGPYEMRDVIQVRVENNRVVISSPLESFDGERVVKFKHGDDSATIDFHPMAASPAPDQPRFIQMYRYDFRDPKSVFFHTSVLAHPGYTQIAGSWELLEGMRDVSIIDTEEKLDDAGGKDDAALTFRVHAIDDDGNETHKIEFTAPDLKTLQRKHPAEVNEYLRPVFRELECESLLDIDPTLAWQVFAADARPDPKLVARINELLPKLDAAEFTEREQAAESLKKLGPSAAVAMLQLDRTKLSVEQNTRLEEILTAYEQLPAGQAEKLGRDPAFLLSAMDSEDPELRRVAAARLAKNVGHSIGFDPSAGAEERHAATAVLRKELTAPPTTHAIEKPQ